MTENVEIQVKGKKYNVSFPNVGQWYEMETEKQRLGKGYYNAILGNFTDQASAALDMIDIQATLTILVPELASDIKVPFERLGLADYNEIKAVYMEKVWPMIAEAKKLLASIK